MKAKILSVLLVVLMLVALVPMATISASADGYDYTYYVSATGDDSANTGLTPDSPLKNVGAAYKKFVAKYRSESSLGKNTAGGSARAVYHPIISKSGEAIRAARKQSAKDAAMNLYRRLRQQGKPDAEAKRAAQDYYNKMTSN